MPNVMTMAISNHGETIHIGDNPPRKYLMDHFGASSCTKQYIETGDGRTVHNGYVIGDVWLTLYVVTRWEKEVEHG